MAEETNLVELTAEIVSAHVSNNSVAVGDVANLVQQVHGALAALGQAATAEETKKTPAATARASVKPDYLICMECGKKQKTLKRHLMTAHGLSPQQYRADFGLPASYPMTAPNYSMQRQEMAKRIGLGRKTGATTKGTKAAPAKRGRKPRASKAANGDTPPASS